MVFFGVNHLIDFLVEIQFWFLFIVFRGKYLFDKHFLKISSFLLLKVLHRIIANEVGERCQPCFVYFSHWQVFLCTDNVEHWDCIFLRGMSFQTQTGERKHSKKRKMAWLCLPRLVRGDSWKFEVPEIGFILLFAFTWLCLKLMMSI